jgi:hypothetical protein
MLIDVTEHRRYLKASAPEIEDNWMSPKARATLVTQLTDSDIAQRAYNRWIARGRPVSDGREDWYAAEAELLAERAPQPQPTPPRRRPIRSALRRLGI